MLYSLCVIDRDNRPHLVWAEQAEMDAWIQLYNYVVDIYQKSEGQYWNSPEHLSNVVDDSQRLNPEFLRLFLFPVLSDLEHGLVQNVDDLINLEEINMTMCPLPTFPVYL